MSAVNIGIALPVRENAILGASEAGPLMKTARQVEELGYDSVWVGDSFVARHRLEPLTLLAAIAMVTDRVTIGTAALTASLREPSELAHTIVTLDQLSSGRLKLALAVGAPLPVQAEYDAVTMPYKERTGRVDEAVKFYKKVWRGEEGSLVGEYINLSALRSQSPPTQVGGPPLWMAANGKPDAVRRCGTLYDGWMPIKLTPEQYAKSLAAIRETAAAAGRDPAAISTALYVTVNINSDADEAIAGLNNYTHTYNELPLDMMVPYQLYFGGSEQAFVEWLSEYVAAGCRHVVLRLGTFDNYERHLRAIAEGVAPALHAMNVD